MLKTRLCHELGIDHPIFSAGMGVGMSGAALTAAVSNAGAFGVLGAGGLPAEVTRDLVRETRRLTAKPFGVNILLPLLHEGQIEACLAEKVAAIVLFWGDPTPYVGPVHRAGIKLYIQVGSIDEAEAAAAAGVDGLIVQGNEAGGHVKSTTALSSIVPAVLERVTVPIIASGGIATGRGIVAALSLGAQAVSIGTRFVASTECEVEEEYKRRIVAARAEDTVYTTIFDVGWPDAPHRVLKNEAFAEWSAAGAPRTGERPGEGVEIGALPLAGQHVPVVNYSVFPPVVGFKGDYERAALYCGESCNLVHDIKPAAEIVRDLVAEAERGLKALAA
ncbi:MAG: nitronate monooxygenase [Gammaproteobacteria bacterium]|nr:nitronate monooxygenase [Gammaproteobacteria bacterium]